MNKFYESTRDKNIKMKASEAILQGLSNEGGLFVYRDLKACKLDVAKLVGKDYYQIAIEVLKLFLHDFSEEEVEHCVYHAYQNKFSKAEVTPLVSLSDGYVLELFNGPTSAFKDVGLSMLPQLTKTALAKSAIKEDILILTATSGDTGKAALEGFKDVPRTKIMVFYPNHGVSTVQEAQMKTQEGKNVKVCAIEGNFDDAQTGIKNLFVDEDFKKELANKGIKLSSANSINIGRLIPQMVYYVYAYTKLVADQKIQLGEEVNFVVPTGNFGNILAGYYAKQVGLPIHQLVCASNENNVLYDFLTTGTYNRKRHFLKTISPSMDILISSNLERLLYYVSDGDNAYVKSLMEDLNQKGEYRVNENIQAKIKESFACGYATNEETQATIKKVYEQDHYLLDPHSAVAYKVLLEHEDKEHVSVVLSTASPYKFTRSVYEALYHTSEEDEFQLMKQLHEKTKVAIPANLKDLDQKAILHQDVIEKTVMKQYVLKKVDELK
ncbi:MAG: threonine synthase [Erysipelotrichia bacterium]|nr:threonine synthase [Erysipelotrichia bacterium]NCC54792.1 threonine synthase [Erysipelotrichia bacterium]